MSGWRERTYAARSVRLPDFSSKSGVPPVYIVPSGSPNSFRWRAASSRSRQEGCGAAGFVQASSRRMIAPRSMPLYPALFAMTPLLRWGRGLLRLEMLRPHRPADTLGPFALTGNQALAIARPGLAISLRGAVTHEMLETLKSWGVKLVTEGQPYAPPLLEIDAELVVAPAEDIGAVRAKKRIALIAADEELPDLPRSAELPPGVE